MPTLLTACLEVTPARTFRRSLLAVIAALVVATSGLALEAHAQQGASAANDTRRPTAADSLTLEVVVEQVLATYPSIDAARRYVDAATARVGQARSGYWPHVSASATYQRQDPVPEVTIPGGASGPGPSGGTSIGIQPNNFYDGHLQARQTLYDFGRTNARIEQAGAGRTAAVRRVDVERSALAFQAVQAFYTARLADARLAVQRDQIDRLQRTLDVVRRQQDAGTATEFEVQSTQTRLSAARSQLSRFRSERRRQDAELRRLLGRAVGGTGTIPLSDPTPSDDDVAIDVDSLTARAVHQHPSVRVAEAQVRSARQGVQVAHRSDAPSLSLNVQGGVQNGYPSDLNEPRLNESIGLSFTVPLFEGLAARRRVEEATAEVEAARSRLSDVRRQVQTRVAQAASDLQALVDRRASVRQRVEQARTAAELARTRYEAGTITNLDLLEAETQLREARLEQTEIRYQILLARYTLQRAAGTLLPFRPLP